jgi:peptidyl-prolyl cis-trans isomerase B (cyclophilin B)
MGSVAADPLNLLGQAGDEVGALGGRAALRRLQAHTAEAAAKHRVGRVEGGFRPQARGDHREPAWAEHAGDLGEEGRHVELRDEVEGLGVVREVGGIPDLEGHPALRIEPDPLLRAADHLLGDVDTANTSVWELACDQKRAVAKAGPDVEGTLGLGVDVYEAGRERGQVLRGGPVPSLIPGRGLPLPEPAAGSAKQGPEERRPGDRGVQEAPDKADAPARRSETGLREVRLRHDGIIASAAGRLAAVSTGRTALAAALAVVLLAGCGGGGGGEGETSADLPAGCSEASAPPARQVNLPPPDETLRGPATAVVETSCGTFEIALDTERAPTTTSSFAYLARQGAYEDTAFHRIVPGFVIQGGDPTGSGTGGPGYFVDEQPPENLSYVRGVVAMAKTAAEPPGRSGSQFFVVTQPDAGLTPDYALLGRVSAGMDVVDRIESLGSPDGIPKAPVVIRGITIQRPGT